MASTRAELDCLHAELADKARAIMRKKSIDYAREDDVYANLGEFGLLGILVRLSDKLARLRRYVENGGRFVVEDESRLDTVLDAINYLILFEGMARHKTPAAQSLPAEDAARDRLRCGARTRENAPSVDSSKTPPPWLDRSQLESWQELSRLYLRHTDIEGPEPLDPEGTLGL